MDDLTADQKAALQRLQTAEELGMADHAAAARKQLAASGLGERAIAGLLRKATAEDAADEAARTAPPKGRTSTPKSTTSQGAKE